MANIAISDLRPAGSELFMDSESYLNDLTDAEMMNTKGASSLVCITIGIAISVHGSKKGWW
ncbi:hypothetical protein VB620_06565 [Nodularia harveyana UHCC-0300]|uniref:Uncharacterized protein n=2 Tax=Nodularia harveyana TaxID=114805 RepID=A0ABU5UBU9_9CYAN|nr:hypothetical protein [Nodularia harveyana]MEA5581002.1 hypothetical protein [Nodularia harveyana UHCC-0300]